MPALTSAQERNVVLVISGLVPIVAPAEMTFAPGPVSVLVALIVVALAPVSVPVISVARAQSAGPVDLISARVPVSVPVIVVALAPVSALAGRLSAVRAQNAVLAEQNAVV